MGRHSFVDARKWCQEQGYGWDLAHVPTEMHNFAVYDLFTKTYGSDKEEKGFKFFWIGLFDTRKGKGDTINRWVWVSGDPESDANKITGTDVQYYKFTTNIQNTRYGAMKKENTGLERQRGAWADQPGWETFRFVCSRYREEYCPRISHTSIRNAYKVTFISKEDGTETLEIVKGTSIKVSCMKGYAMQGKSGKCLKSGQWKKIPICFSKNACKVLKKKDVKKAKSVSVNGVISKSYAEEGSVIAVICKKKYDLVQQGQIACKNGEWTIFPECIKRQKKRD